MKKAKQKIQILVLAGGKGRRMNSDRPKVLLPVLGKPVISHLLSSIADSKICETPAIIVGYKAEEVKKELGPSYIYAYQKDQLGTGHAVLSAREVLRGKAHHILVLYGDHPLVSSQTIQNLADSHLASKSLLTMATVKTEDFSDWRSFLYDYGRIIRDNSGKIIRSVETKDATEEERKITEVNPCYYCINAEWLWNNLEKVQNNNVQKEYYLTDLVALARASGIAINSVNIDPVEAFGANTREQLEVSEKILKEKTPSKKKK